MGGARGFIMEEMKPPARTIAVQEDVEILGFATVFGHGMGGAGGGRRRYCRESEGAVM